MSRMENEHDNIVPYRRFLAVLAILIVLTLISVAVTKIYLGALTVAAALIIATIKSTFVLRIFMHLKFDNKFFSVLVSGVVVLLALVIIVTLSDYIFR